MLPSARLRRGRPSQEELDQTTLRGADLSGLDLSGLSLAGRDLTEALLARADLAGADLSGATLTSADLSDTELTGAQLTEATLDGARLCRARGPGAVFAGASLVGVDLTGAYLPEGDWTAADLEGVVAQGARLEGGDFAQAALRRANLRGAALDLASLDGADLSEAELAFSTLERCQARGAVFSGARLGKARLDGATLAEADLREADLRGARLRSVDLSGARFDGARAGSLRVTEGALTETQLTTLREGGLRPVWWRRALTAAQAWIEGGGPARLLEAARSLVPEPPPEPDASPVAFEPEPEREPEPAPEPARRELRQEDLVPGADLRGQDLRRFQLEGVDLSGADLRSARLDGRDLRGASLRGARLDGARLERTDLRDSDLTGASAESATFDGARLDAAVLRDLHAEGATFLGATFRGAEVEGASFVFANLAEADFRGGTLAGLDVRGARLDGANLTGARIAGLIAEPRDLAGVIGVAARDLDELGQPVESGSAGDSAVEAGLARVVGAAAEWVRSGGLARIGQEIRDGLSGRGGGRRLEALAVAQPFPGLPRARPLRAALVAGATLDGADLTGLDLSGLDLTNASLRRACLDGALLEGTALDGADLTGASLHGAQLMGTALAGATLDGAVLDDAALQGVDLTGCSGEGVRLVGARLADCVWSGARFHGASFVGAQLVGEDLEDADVSGAQFELAHLRGADLTAASLADADLRGVASLPAGSRALTQQGALLSRLPWARLAATLALTELTRRVGASVIRGMTRAANFIREGGLRRPVTWVRQGRPQALVRARWAALVDARRRFQPDASRVVPGASFVDEDLRRARLSGADLSGADLTGADLSGADLRKARLAGARLVGTRLLGANLAGADLTEADLSEALLRDAALGGARLTRANAGHADLESCDLVEADLSDTDLRGARLVWADLSGVDLSTTAVDAMDVTGALGLSDADLRSLADRGAVAEARAEAREGLRWLRGAWQAWRARQVAPPDEVGPGRSLAGLDLRAMALAGKDLSGADLTGCRLEDMDLRAVNLRGATLDGARFGRARLDGADLSQAHAHGAEFADAQLRGADLRALDARSGVFEGATLRGARLDGAVLAGAALSACDLTETDLADADLTGADLGGAVVEAAVIGRVVGLSGPEMDGLLERGARLEVLELPVIPQTPREGLAQRVLRAIPGRRREPPPDLVLVAGSDLAGRDLRRLLLGGLDLSGCNLRDARLDGADLTDTRLAGARMDGARLTGALMKGVDLAGASAADARFDDADLSGADLSRLRAAGSSWIGASLGTARFDDTSLVDADLSAATLRGAALADTDLSGALLDQTDLEGADLTGVVVQGTDLVGALGLSAEDAEALSARGARRGGLRLPPFLRGLLTPQAAGVVLTAGVAVAGFVLLVQSGSPDAERVELEAAAEVELGEHAAALLRYRELLELSASPSERIRVRYEIARLLEDEGDLPGALAQYESAVLEAETGEEAGEAFLKLAACHAALNDRAAERAALGQVLARVDTPSRLYAEALVGLVDSHRSDGDDDRAEGALDDWFGELDSNPGRALSVGLAVSDLAASRGEYERALAVLERLGDVSLDREQRNRVALRRAQLAADRGDPSTADRLYDELLRSSGIDQGRVRLAAAEVAWQLDDIERALSLVQQARRLGTHPDVEARLLVLEARLRRAEGDDAAASALYQRVLDGFAEDVDAYAAAQLGLAETLSDDEQLAMVDELLEAGEPERAARLLLSRAAKMRVTGRPLEAEVVYQQVLELGAEDEARLARLEMAAIAIEDERVEEGIRLLRDIQAEIDGTERVDIEAAIADALRYAGRLDDAEFAYSGLIAGYPEGSDAQVRGLLGQALVSEARGNIQDARRGYLDVLDATTSPALRSEALSALAGNYMETGESDRALSVWRSFLAGLPEGHESSFDAYDAMAQILRARGERGAALEQYDALLRATASAERKARAQVAVGELLEEDGQFDAALLLYGELLDDAELPEDEWDSVFVGLVRSLLSVGRPEEALAFLNARSQDLRDQETEAAVLSLKAQALRALGRNEEAARYEQAVEADAPELDDAFSSSLAQANELVNEWDFEGAIALYTQLGTQAEDRPTQASILDAIAQARALSGDTDGARADYRRLGRDFSDLPEAVFLSEMGLAWVDRQAGESARAVERYRGLTAPDPGSDVWRLEQLATALQEAGRDDEAERVYKDLIQGHEGDEMAQATGSYGLAELMRARGETAAARGLYEKVARTSPDEMQARWSTLHVAMLLVDEGELDDAEEVLEELLEADPEIALQARIGLSSIELERGRAGRALDWIEDVDASELGGGWVATLAQQEATCHLAGGDPDKARKVWARVLSDYGEIDDIASQAHLALGDLALGDDAPDDALARFERVADETADPYYRARALLGQGDALRALDRDDAARAAYRQVIEQHGDLTDLRAIAEAHLD